MLRAIGKFRTVLQFTLMAGVVVCAAARARAQAPAQNPPKNSDEQFKTLIRSVEGPDLYRAYCASCHGKDGKGDGPAAASLKAKVPDLTVLAKNNGGKFPAARVRRVIMGEDVLASHGSRDMPIWGPIFHQVEEDVDRGYVRLDNLVKYIQSIQAPAQK